jgi:hypothetical protein
MPDEKDERAELRSLVEFAERIKAVVDEAKRRGVSEEDFRRWIAKEWNPRDLESEN